MRSAELKAGAGLDGVEQLGPEHPLVGELGHLEQVHAGAGSGQAVGLLARIVDAERWVQVLWDTHTHHTVIGHQQQPCPRCGCRTLGTGPGGHTHTPHGHWTPATTLPALWMQNAGYRSCGTHTHTTRSLDTSNNLARVVDAERWVQVLGDTHTHHTVIGHQQQPCPHCGCRMPGTGPVGGTHTTVIGNQQQCETQDTQGGLS